MSKHLSSFKLFLLLVFLAISPLLSVGATAHLNNEGDRYVVVDSDIRINSPILNNSGNENHHFNCYGKRLTNELSELPPARTALIWLDRFVLSKNTGKGKNKLKPDPEATGNHTVFQRGNDDKVFKYETYEQTKAGYMNPTKRYDGGKPDANPWAPHRNQQTVKRVPTPHVQGKGIHSGVRPAKPGESPK